MIRLSQTGFWIAGVVLVLLFLTACDDTKPVVIQAPPRIEEAKLRDLIPSDLLKCLKNPDGSAVTTIRQSAKYIVDLKRAGDDCRNRLAAVRQIILQQQ